MSEDTKKQSKNKNDPKEQRKRRGRQQQQPASEKKPIKEPEPAKSVSKAPEKSAKPTCEPPPPEFYKNLKRETDEILKITEEANSKYKKKEILSNWAKYEMPIESYEEIDEQENLGADYETLANTPLSIGGHFQFKHEKSWDENTGPSPYDKYFDINMDNLHIALCTIPFYKRNELDQVMFSELDVQNMNQRAMKFKQKYFNDKKYMTPEIEAQEKILKNLIDNEAKPIEVTNKKEIDFSPNISYENTEEPSAINNSIESFSNAELKTDIKEPNRVYSENNMNAKISAIPQHRDVEEKELEVDVDKKPELDNILKIKDDIQIPSKKDTEIEENEIPESRDFENEIKATGVSKNPIIESPEDLEKWLDEFLDE